MTVDQILAWTIPAGLTVVGVAWAIAWAYVNSFQGPDDDQ